MEDLKDSNLISGADANLAWVNGKDVEYQNKVDLEGIWFDLTESNLLGIFTNDRFIFRIKPQTIKLELELPKPFEPKHGDWYWFIDTNSEDGYSKCQFYNDNDDKKYLQLGSWATEAEVKQVVEQLRKIKGAV